MEKQHPKHIIAVSAYITDDNGEVLLVRTHDRADTWESPGGQVEEGEPLDQAVCREVYEETNIEIDLIGITGIYYSVSKNLLSVVFKATYKSGDIDIQVDEIQDAAFIPLNESNIDDYITRPHMKSRTLDAMNAKHTIPYETWDARTQQLLGRIN
ncbi:NUDIX domain-containing protein [Pontibacillus yanchengensis]|uniref:NUDIX domain-containing protein n=2 Tax=Pontibacillus yanchengensis TaxID=462910 RepID=A0ACC7VLE6_9BACI|nr:NUDIX hydrolase [Pontibacillus yanchengensis]MYL32576.1 NUDIX domain-containing protein [Pontibacillus yanchengensis]MYL54970.1 NUDIX domain-containing protein [Pontibacillus yanchengensis]